MYCQPGCDQHHDAGGGAGKVRSLFEDILIQASQFPEAGCLFPLTSDQQLKRPLTEAD